MLKFCWTTNKFYINICFFSVVYFFCSEQNIDPGSFFWVSIRGYKSSVIPGTWVSGKKKLIKGNGMSAQTLRETLLTRDMNELWRYNVPQFNILYIISCMTVPLLNFSIWVYIYILFCKDVTHQKENTNPQN